MSEQGTYAKILRVDSIGVRVETRIANGSLAINAITVAYDALGRQVEAHDAAGVTTYGYDAYGANTDETVIGVAGTNVLERFTDAYGRNAGYAINGVRQTIFGYDEQTGRLATMQVNSTGLGSQVATRLPQWPHGQLDIRAGK